MKPSTYTQAAADEIVRRLSEGEPLAWICRDAHMPAKRTVSDWRAAHPDFKEAMRAARKSGYDVIAMRSRLTIRGKTAEEGGESTGDVQRDKAIVEHDLKLLAKWDTERYGDRMKLSGDAKNPLNGLTDEQLDARLKKLMASQDPDGEPA
ncbi:hypothetical protein [Lysobacter capsici]|uniref:terminase small subunit-like protein n=1 Tax=Lysobacter capsici TaxID=435897 RepID=UPI00287BB8AB|nr:hypothetical protein [Lysobacter capsici]WND79394.1 hypothetical protein RJ610_19135 [Lysobacter capsici]WND84590.1 hypothetical protein RJ609_19150 [Lysobacter capsici]